MASREDADRLHRMWSREILGRLQDKWIAFGHGDILLVSENVEAILDEFAQEFEKGDGPIIAFVDFEPLQ